MRYGMVQYDQRSKGQPEDIEKISKSQRWMSNNSGDIWNTLVHSTVQYCWDTLRSRNIGSKFINAWPTLYAIWWPQEQNADSCQSANVFNRTSYGNGSNLSSLKCRSTFCYAKTTLSAQNSESSYKTVSIAHDWQVIVRCNGYKIQEYPTSRSTALKTTAWTTWSIWLTLETLHRSA